MTTNNVYLNGRMVPADEAKVSVFDSGFLHGVSAFTTMLAHKGRVFRLDRHVARVLETVELLGLRIDATKETLTGATFGLLEANGLLEARVRMTLTPGSADGGETTTLITAKALAEHPRQWYEKGITVVVSPFKQSCGDPTCGYKTGCYFPRVLARKEAAARGAEEALWFTVDNRLAESCFNNVFLVLAGRLHTPPRDTPVLPGIVRQAVVELCEELEIPCDAESPLTVKEMLAAEEMFLTGSITGIRPVVRVERHAVGQEKPGQVTKKLMSAYSEMLERECS